VALVRRGLVIVSGFLVTVAVATGIALRGWGAAAEEVGRRTYYYRPDMTRSDPLPPPAGRRVLWFGDSMLMGARVYPLVLAHDIPGLESHLVVLPGLDAFGFYCVMDRRLRRHAPDAVVLEAHLGSLHHGLGARVGDLVGQVPAGELGTAFLLPLHDFGLTLPKALLFRLTVAGAGERLLFLLDGMNRLVQDAGWWAWAGPPRLRGREVPLPQVMSNVYYHFSAPLSARTPQVRMLAAAVSMAVRRGLPVLVVVEPLPLREIDPTRYAPAPAARRVATLRREVEAAGGRSSTFTT
jgi:hypothetical protein